MKLQIHLILKFNFDSINFTKLLRALQPTLVLFDQFLFKKIKISKLKKKESPQIDDNLNFKNPLNFNLRIYSP
jgi:hypothetical protein